MKHILIIALFGVVTISSSFDSHKPLLPTSLKISVIDIDSIPVQGVTVTLYGNKKDYRAGTNPLFPSKKSNAKGIVVFKKLKTQQYYIHAVLGDKSNIGEEVLTNKLQEGRINKVTTVID